MNEEMANYKALVKTAEKRKDELEKQSIEMAKKMFIEHENLER